METVIVALRLVWVVRIVVVAWRLVWFVRIVVVAWVVRFVLM